ncbi:nucleoside hydrolase [Alteromonas sp. 1_MG-2023]|uniref:nucleoside hydrolase n=1 Tax=Alteromonas sp. 1_MG-2023 TaxID=3062669 RepID=UPI0026E227E0|nr:nucleoside hydrolase [Alteromonas sp. 1_MG-2023]MDO6567587.1 nucleoside hydrolase [Alteromonas sp. 1_MG-2023]
MEKIIFDTDPGIDDAMAILFAQASANIDLVAITTGFGNANIDTATRNALYLKKRFNLSADVARGAKEPLVIPVDEPADFVHGDNGLGNIDIDETDLPSEVELAAHDYIIEKLKASPGEITLVAVGRMTNLALALRKCPEIVKLVKRVVIMGGAFGYHGNTGNVTPYAEANIIGDPHAADEVLTADWPVTVVGLDVTKKVIMSNDYLASLAECSPKYGPFIYDITRFYANFHQQTDQVDGIYVHDSSAIMQVIAPQLFKTVDGPIRVITEGPAIGHTIQKTVAKRFPIDEWADYPAQSVCSEVGVDAYLAKYKDILSQAAFE